MQKLRRVGLETGELTDEETKYVDTEIVQTVYPLLIGRQVFPIKRLPDAGFLTNEFYKETDMGQATISMTGETQSRDRIVLSENTVKIPVLSKDFKLHWRDVIAARRRREGLDLASVRNAARQVAEEEDKLLLSGEYTGWAALGIEGLSTATGRNTEASAGAWSTIANIIADIKDAIEELVTDGYYGPYAVIVRPTQYVAMLAQLTSTAESVLTYVKENLLGGKGDVLISANLYSSAGGTDSGLVTQPGADNFDIIVGQDVTNYLVQDEDMNTLGKVYEVLSPRVKRAESICEITGIT